MWWRRCLAIVGCVAVLGAGAPGALASPQPQGPVPAPYGGASQAGLLQALQQAFSPELFQQTPLQLAALDGNTYVVSHPRLFWPVDQAVTAQFEARRLASLTPGWDTTIYNGPQGYGAYLTYQPVTFGATPQTGLLSAVQQVLPPDMLQQTPLQLASLDPNTYVVSHPGLFWPTSQASLAQATAQQLASLSPGWSTTVYNGPQGYGAYLTYQPVGVGGGTQVGLLPAVQQILPAEMFQQTPLQLAALDGNTYVVSHPQLFWPTSQMPMAQATAQQLANVAPGWSTTIYNGPQGYGAYLTYQPISFGGTPQTGLLPAVQQVLPPEVLQQTPLQLGMLDANTYVVSHPRLFWLTSQAPMAQSVAQRLASFAPGWGTTVYSGPQGYGIYLTYQPLS